MQTLTVHEDRIATTASTVASYQGSVEEHFADNYDHLRALEHEAKLMLAVALMRSFLQQKSSGSSTREKYTHLPFLPPDVTLGRRSCCWQRQQAAIGKWKLHHTVAASFLTSLHSARSGNSTHSNAAR